MNSFAKVCMVLAVPAFLTACSSVSLPNVDFLKLPEFEEDAKNVKDYPKVADAPQMPVDTRTSQAWDDSARALLAKRDSFNVPLDGNPEKSEEQLLREFEALKAKVDAYKADDPQ